MKHSRGLACVCMATCTYPVHLPVEVSNNEHHDTLYDGLHEEIHRGRRPGQLHHRIPHNLTHQQHKYHRARDASDVAQQAFRRGHFLRDFEKGDSNSDLSVSIAHGHKDHTSINKNHFDIVCIESREA